MPPPAQNPRLGSVLLAARGRLITELVCLVLFFSFSLAFCSHEPVADYHFVDRPDGPFYISGVGIILLVPVSVVFMVNGFMLGIQLIKALLPTTFTKR